MDTRKLSCIEGTTAIRSGDAIIATVRHDSVNAPREHARNTAAELVRRWNAYTELVEALKGLVQTIEFQAEGNFLNEDADEGEENDLTRARAILQTLKTN